MKRYYGSIIKRGKYYHWRFQNADGLYTSRVIVNETGGKVTNYEDAEVIASRWAMELTNIQHMKNRQEAICKIAEAKALLHVCRLPLAEIEEAFFEHPSAPSMSIRHRKNYHSVLKSFIEFASCLHIHKVSDVTEDIAQAYLAYYWKKGVAPKTYNSVLNMLQCVFRLLNRDNNPFSGFKKKSAPAEERQPFTVEQLQAIWNTLTSPDYHMLYKEEMIVLYKLALYTGARCGDLCLLRWSSVDMQSHIIRFMPHKTSLSSRKIVEIPICRVLFEALCSLDQTTDYVLPNVASRYQHNPGGIARDTKKLLLAAGLTPTDTGTTRRMRAVSRMGFHGFRHTYVSMLIANGVNPLVVRDLVGHTSVDMTARYNHVSLTLKQQAVDTLAIP